MSWDTQLDLVIRAIPMRRCIRAHTSMAGVPVSVPMISLAFVLYILH